MELLERIQRLPEKKRKIILWATLAVMAVISLYFLLTNFQEKLKNFDSENFQKELNIPGPEMPELNLPPVQ